MAGLRTNVQAGLRRPFNSVKRNEEVSLGRTIFSAYFTVARLVIIGEASQPCPAIHTTTTVRSGQVRLGLAQARTVQERYFTSLRRAHETGQLAQRDSQDKLQQFGKAFWPTANRPL